MEIRIGVRNVAREVVVESDESSKTVQETVNAALTDGKPLVLTDEKGRTVVVPNDALGYVEIAAEAERRVGFGA